ncbi:retention module-containing protein [Cellvibrio fibrivorans]|uniref:VCBS repeat-containing protein n=1 Tax=Cellvibrio fibrivorans TaxID=126350 RepID=A0ABU1V0I8_9GAMM|nr:retention module-containing protein [Cellvibrio fibrivorans]MDR7090925.1 VCBS repeat-containing protein [Cellvibrio fibrivorans]
MSNAVAKVSFLQGQAWAKAPDGTLRALTVGSTLNDDEILVTAEGARVELDVGSGEPLVVNGGAEVGMSRDFLADTATGPDEALLSDASVQEALTVLEQGGDLLEELEETAAGDAGGGGSSEGHNFVQLTRVIESTDSQAFDYTSASQSGQIAFENDANYINRAPLVTDQVIVSNEDEAVTGQIIADDIEDDALTFTVATPPVNGVLVIDPVTGQFTFTPNANYNGTDGFVVTVTDSRGNSTNTSITLNIAPVNDAPTTSDINLTTDEDVPVNGQVVAQDIENDTLSYVVSGQPVNGTVVLDPATGTFVYTPNANYNGSDSFVVTVSDGNGGTTTSTVTIGVNPVNDTPVSNDQSLVTDEDVPVSGQVVASDIDGDTLGYTVSGVPTNGTVVLNPVTGSFVYTPNANYNGGDNFVVTISDGKGGTTTSTITIGVNPVNDAPVSSDQNLSTPEDTPISGQVTATDIDGDTLGYAVSGQPTNGTVTLNPATGGFVYTPNANYNGSDSFVVTISDGNGGTTTSRVNIGVTPVNDAPVSNDQNLTTPEDTPLPGQVVATDIEGDTLAYVVSGQPANGTVALDPVTGSFVYTPGNNYNGSDSFVVTISDGNGGTTTSLINIGVTPINDAPVSSDQNLTTLEDTSLSGQVVASDIEGDTLGYAVSGQPTNGSVSLNPATGSFVYTPNANYNGSDSFIVTISDGKGGATTSRINIGVTPVNDAPVSNNQNLSTPEDTPINGQISASDIDGGALGYLISGSPANGSVTLNAATGSFVYTPNAGYNGSDSFVVTISDGNGGTTTSRVNIGVTPVNDVPTAGNLNLTTDEDVPVNGAISANDPDGDTLSYTVTGNPASGTVVLNPATGTFTYTPNAGYGGSDSFVVSVSDGKGGVATSTVTIGVNSLNDDPVASDLNLTTAEDTAVNGAISATDAESDPLSYSVTGNPANGTVVLNPATGTFVYTPNANYNGSDSFVVTISDGNGGTTTSNVVIVVTPDNDAPTAADLNLTTDENAPVNGAISANDPDGDALSYTVTGNPAQGTVVLNPVTGTFTYTPNAGYNGSDSFVVIVSDGNGGSTTSTVTIGVNPVNDAPVANADSINVAEGGVATTLVGGATSVLANDTDADLDALTAVLVTGPANGTLTLNADGTFSYLHDGSETTTDSFTYKVNDGTEDGNTVTVNINVTPVNDAPVTVADSITVNEGGTATLLESGATSVLANDSDAENSPLSAILVSGPAHGTLTLNANGTFSYTHNGSETTSDSFTYRANDGTNNGNIVTVQIAITPVNDAPIAVNDTANVDEGSSVMVAVRTNDSDPEGGVLTVASVSQGANGSVVIDAVTGNPVYTPNTGFSGNDSFTYTVQDPSGVTATATVNVVVKANAPSVLVQDLDSAPEDNDVTGNVLTNDTDSDDTLTVASFQISGLGSFTAGQTALIAGVGSLVVNTDGSYVFDPVADWNGAVPQVTYTTNTGFSSTLDITVTPVNDAPVAVDDFYTINEDDVWSMPLPVSDLVTNDSDPDGDSVRVVILENAVNGTLSVVSGNLVFTPNAEFSGTASFDYRITDDKGGVDKGTVFINVVAVNDPTQAIDDFKTVAEGSNATGNVLTNDVDPDSNPQVASFVINGTTYNANDSVTLPGVGQFTLLANGDYTFEPIDNNFNGAVPTVTYTTDTGASADLNITLTPVNDAPVAVDDTFTITTNTTLSLPLPLSILVANDTDVDNDTLRVTTVTSESNGTLQVVGGNLVFTPTPGFTGVASFTYIVTDDKGGVDSGRVNINVVAAPNQAPETNVLNVSGDEDTLITINLAGSDSDGSVAGYVIKSLPTNGLLYSDAAMTTLIAVDDLVSGPVYFKPDADWNGASQFNYAARDDKGLDDSTPATVNISVNPVADVAVVGSGAGTVKEDTPAQSTAAGTLSITDPDAGEAGFEVQTNTAGTYGSFSITSTGNWTYNIDNSKTNVQQLKEGETKTEIFTVKSIDGTTSSVVITVAGTNDGPTAVADSGTTLRNTALTFAPADLLGNDTDPDGDILTIDSVQGAVNGNVSLVAGNVVFVPTAGYSGPASFTYTISDGKGGSSTASVDITVVKPNTAPDANDDAAASTGSGNIGLVSEYFGYSDPANGSNLTNLQQINTFINGRTPDATFVAKTFDYGNTAFNNGLGNGTNLQSFLGSDAASLSADPATTTDAIIRMRGFVELGAGTYNFKVTADDGYQIRVDGVVVAEVNQNQTVKTTIHNLFTLTTSGLHTVEVIYWDQGISARLKLELSDDAGTSYDLLSSIPTYKNVIFSAVEDTALAIPASSLLGNDTDADGDTLVIQSVQGAVNGSVNLVAGSIVFTPAANYSGPASFTYTISDGKGGTDTATVNLVVAPVNDAPTTVADSGVAASNGSLSIPIATLLSNDSDPEGEVISFVSVQGAVNGTVAVSGNNVVFTPTANYEGPASFTYTVRDPLGNSSNGSVTVNVGAASAPSVAVLKSVVALAHGTGGTSVKFPIMTSLVDTDGSETLSIKISGVPTGLSFNSGTNLGGGVWQFTTADLPNLTLNLPGSYTTTNTSLTVQVTATESTGGFTASTSTTVALRADYTTVDITTTESGNYTGNSANEYIQGGSGNNTISAANGNNVVSGGDGNDTITSGSGNDVIFGGSGNDTISSGVGTDRISGGAGNDTMSGFADNFVDVFVWGLGDQGAAGAPAEDTINNFVTTAAGGNTNGGDVLDLRDLLQGEHVGASNGAGNLADYLHFEISGANTIVHISHTGGFSGDTHTVGAGYTGSAETQKITLTGVNLQSLYSGATTDQQIITQLLNNNKLITD